MESRILRRMREGVVWFGAISGIGPGVEGAKVRLLRLARLTEAGRRCRPWGSHIAVNVVSGALPELPVNRRRGHTGTRAGYRAMEDWCGRVDAAL